MSIIFDALQKTQKQRGTFQNKRDGKTHLLKLMVIFTVTLGIFASLVIKPFLTEDKKQVVLNESSPQLANQADVHEPLMIASLPPNITPTIEPVKKSVSENKPEITVATNAPPKNMEENLKSIELKLDLAERIKKSAPLTHTIDTHHFILTGILEMGEDKIAMINNQPLHIGESISDDSSTLKLIRISENSVTLKEGKESVTLMMGTG